MKLTAIAYVLIIPFSYSASEPTCNCQPLGPPDAPSFLVTRLWNIANSSWTDQDVIDEFDAGFAPMVTALPGFQRYTAAFTGDPSTVFFMNAFDDPEKAHVAQEAAKEFVDQGKLNGVIVPNHFTEDAVIAGFSSKDCPRESRVGMHLSTRAYYLVDPTDEPEFHSYSDFHQQVLSQIDGFQTYVGSHAAPEGKDAFAFNIFDTKEAADESNKLATTASANQDFGYPASELVVATDGLIAFDYTCAAGNAPSSSSHSTSSREIASITIVGVTVATLVACFLL